MKLSVFFLSLGVALGAAGCDDGSSAARDAGVGALACVAPAGMGTPQTIAEVVELMNALPAPVTVACFVEALDRPLQISATRGVVSAQPADGPENPRIFIFSGQLLLSVAPAGVGRDVVELGEPFGAGQSLKGELIMPLRHPVTADAPFDHLRYNDLLTACGLCHRDERLEPEVGHPNAFVSVALRPVIDELVPLDTLRMAHATCDAEAEPVRCGIYRAIFEHGPVVERDFPVEMATIFDR